MNSVDRITISRTANCKENPITIEIESDDFKIIYYGEMGLDDFAKCITGYAHQPIVNKFEAYRKAVEHAD